MVIRYRPPWPGWRPRSQRPSTWELERAGKRRGVWRGIGVAVLVVALVVLAITAGLFQRRGDLPPELMGRWRTADARYADRAMELTRNEIRFYQGGALISSHRLTRIRERQEGDVRSVLLIYEDGGGPIEFRLQLGGSQNPVVRFQNQPEMVWYKVESP